MRKFGGNACRQLASYLAACDPARLRANYLFKPNYELIGEYLDGGIFDAS